ncbi:MAG: aspartyl protease family protein [Flavobacterium sp.]|nr:aspartyl protease family protein [Flavobacterium sp.]
MLNRIFTLFLFVWVSFAWTQNGFEIKSNRKKVTIPFKLVNNLIVVPVNVNGTNLNFLLDTGVSETLLFSLDETEQVKFENIEKVRFTGLGNKEPFEGLKSSNNSLKIEDFVDLNHTLYIVLDQDINISSQVGFPINGILGYHFFKNNPIEIKYKRNKIIVYDTIARVSKKIKKSYKKIPISIEENKPYIQSKVFLSDYELNAKLLVDTGNSDALWLFQEKMGTIPIPEDNFVDFLGKGFSGNINGKRARLTSFVIDEFKFKKPLISFPDSLATSGISMVENRIGSVGSEIMKRFNAVYDYKDKSIYLNKNDNFILPFNFNMSGLDVQHEGVQWVKEAYEDMSTATSSQVSFESGDNKVVRNLKYKFELKPSYSILNIRKGSPADLAGLKEGDVIIKINSNFAYNYTLEEIKDILKSEEGKTITLEVERKGLPIKVKFQLKSII